jgi:hypothetical protein
MELADELQDGETSYLIERALDAARPRLFWPVRDEIGSTGNGEEPDIQWKAAARWHEPDDARVSSPDL